MNNKQRKIFFYVFLGTAIIVNGILIYALSLHFVLNQPQAQIEWLLTIFSTEILFGFVYGWYKLVSTKETPSQEKKVDSNTKLHKKGVSSEVSSELNLPRDSKDAYFPLYKMGRNYLQKIKEATDVTSLREFAQKAIKEFSKIPESSSLRFHTLYNLATVYKWYGDYLTSLNYYKKAENYLSKEGKKLFSNREIEISYMGIENMKGKVYLEMKDYPEAERYFDASLSIDHNYFMPIHSKFDLAFERRDVERARILKELLQTYKEYNSVAEIVELKMAILNEKHLRKVA